MKYLTKAAIIGAGFVGSSISYAMAIQGLVSELVLIDVSKTKAEGEAMDINHGLPYLGQMDIYAGDYSDTKDCDVIIITAGQGRKPGESRLDLAKKNSGIIHDIMGKLMQYYTGGVILMVSNPVDILTYVGQKVSGLPEQLMIGTGTVLDSARFRYILSEQLNVDVRNIHGYIIGEHGDSQIPVWSSVNIAGMTCDQYCHDYGIDMDKEAIVEDVRTAGAQVIKRKGTTHYAIASAVCRIVEAVTKNQNAVLPVSTVVTGMYGITDVALSMPSVISNRGAETILKIPYSPQELEKLLASAKQLKEALSLVI